MRGGGAGRSCCLVTLVRNDFECKVYGTWYPYEVLGCSASVVYVCILFLRRFRFFCSFGLFLWYASVLDDAHIVMYSCINLRTVPMRGVVQKDILQRCERVKYSQ